MTISSGERALMLDLKDKEHMITLKMGGRFDTHHGFILHDTLIGQPWGSIFHTNTGHPYLIVQPSTHDLIRHIKRNSQVIFPKDSAHICMKMNIKPGAVVLESGCGSGGLTLALATYVAPTGRVYSQEIREDFLELAKRNMTKYGLDGHCNFILGDGRDGFQVPEQMDAVFLDMPAPETCVTQARAVLKDGGWFGALMPTTNQCQELLRAFEAMPGQRGFGLIEAEEVITRGYKVVPDRFRPRDRMIAHTGYLVFARAIVKPAREAAPELALPADDSGAGE
jgi:tRNA (adenine57-N1/adenine58-N1)-methyltransferase catalytic subunit